MTFVCAWCGSCIDCRADDPQRYPRKLLLICMNRVETPAKTSAVRRGNTSLFWNSTFLGFLARTISASAKAITKTPRTGGWQTLRNAESRCQLQSPSCSIWRISIFSPLSTRQAGVPRPSKSECKGRETSVCSLSGLPLLSVIRRRNPCPCSFRACHRACEADRGRKSWQ